MYYGSKLYLEGEDAETLALAQKVTMVNWGNMLVEKIDRAADTKVYIRILYFYPGPVCIRMAAKLVS